jgi:transposase
LEQSRGFSITHKGLWDALMRVSKACKKEYARLVEVIRDAPHRYVDETTFKGEGRRWYLWIFRTPDGHCLLVMRPTRKGDVVREVLGDEPGPCTVDGYSGYSFIRVLQRCWSHLLREAKEVRDVNRSGAEFHSVLTDIFEPFYSTHREGTGLGLYLARELCEVNRAQLRYIRSAGGNCFYIALAGVERMQAEHE